MQSEELDTPFQHFAKNQFAQQERMGSSLIEDTDQKNET